MEARGVGLSDTGAVQGELQEVDEMSPGDGSTGERRPKELAVARPAGCIDIDMAEIYELLREVSGWSSIQSIQFNRASGGQKINK
jgi:hypothetical protein